MFVVFVSNCCFELLLLRRKRDEGQENEGRETKDKRKKDERKKEERKKEERKMIRRRCDAVEKRKRNNKTKK